MSDEMIRHLARRGGVIHISFNPELVSEDVRSFRGDRSTPRPRAHLSQVAEHICHVIDVAGEDAVGIGSDFDGIEDVPQQLEDVSRFPGLTQALLNRGLTPACIQKLHFLNTMRVMNQVVQAKA
jgi:membrane dipeptidase